MGKKEGYVDRLKELISDLVETGDETYIADHLASNSNLPGPRGNLELAYAFADVVGEKSKNEPVKMWALAESFTNISIIEAPVNDPKDILPFCGAIAIGAIGSTDPKGSQKAFYSLRKMAKDRRWRTREGVAMGLQRMIGSYGLGAIKELDSWIVSEDWLAWRAVAAAVADPPLLNDRKIAIGALALHDKIFDQVCASKERKNEDFKALRRSLGYSLSVVISAVPVEGFELMGHLAIMKDADVRWIVKENTKKNRLIKDHSDEVEKIIRSMS